MSELPENKCNCITEVSEKTRKFLLENDRTNNTESITYFLLPHTLSDDPMVGIPCTFGVVWKKKVRNQKETDLRITIMCQYCPFCGRKYDN